MTHFPMLCHSVPVDELVAQIDAQPELWDNTPLRTYAGGPFENSHDIWVRYNDHKPYSAAEDFSGFHDPHVPVWYDAASKLPALRPILMGIMSHPKIQAEGLYGVFITRIPPGGRVEKHVDRGWHVEFTQKFYVCLRNPEEAPFCVEGEDGEVEELIPTPGDIHFFDNRRPHWVHNNGDHDRMTLIVCVRSSLV